VSGELRVIATAGHVDHGKSSLIMRMTGMDPDRWAEEKRRGLTIDLGYAWCTLPSGREIGFVDVPGHERFVGNMLAGVGPVRLVLFVVAADEGWKPQSEEHLQILDVLGVAGGVVALTKHDLVDEETLAIVTEEVLERVAGTALAEAAVIPVSAETGEGVDTLVAALDALLAAAPAPHPARTRLFVDRVFTIKGAGTVATGTLTGGCLSASQTVEAYPAGRRTRVRGLQTHKHDEAKVCPVTRVAANLTGAERDELARGDVLAEPGSWRPTTVFDVAIRPVRDLERIPGRGAFKVYAGAAEVDAKIRLLDEPFARVRTAQPLVLDVYDRFVVRESGRQRTVGGGAVLDVGPPRAADARHRSFLARRAAAARGDLPDLLIEERGAVREEDVVLLTGGVPPDPHDGWCIAPAVRRAARDAVYELLSAFHRVEALEEGAPLGVVRQAAGDAARRAGAPRAAGLPDTLLDLLASEGSIVRTSTTVRLATHRVALEQRADEVRTLLERISGEHEAQPPTIKELVRAGTRRDVIDAASRAGTVVRISPELVVAPSLVDRAVALVHQHAVDGITVSTFREALGTSRKFAVPLAEWLDGQGITRRRGDVRFPRED
jgi:selenocysteine-specific elongation factor